MYYMQYATSKNAVLYNTVKKCVTVYIYTVKKMQYCIILLKKMQYCIILYPPSLLVIKISDLLRLYFGKSSFRLLPRLLSLL